MQRKHFGHVCRVTLGSTFNVIEPHVLNSCDRSTSIEGSLRVRRHRNDQTFRGDHPPPIEQGTNRIRDVLEDVRGDEERVAPVANPIEGCCLADESRSILRVLVRMTPDGVCRKVKIVQRDAPAVNWPLAEPTKHTAGPPDLETVLSIEPAGDVHEPSSSIDMSDEPPSAVSSGSNGAGAGRKDLVVP